MSIQPIITFKAGICDFDESSSPPKITPRATPGYIYLYSEEDLMHFCWRPRSAHPDDAELDLLMLPTDGSFKPYNGSRTGQSNSSRKSVNGRIYVLKFESSSQRHLFWLQSRSQHASQNPSFFSSRDLKLGEIVDNLLQGEEVDVNQAIADLPAEEHPDADDDETMEDIEGAGDPNEHHRSGSGGAGPDATGGDVREEGQGSREGGADGGRAATSMDASQIIQNFINSMPGGQGRTAPQQDRLFTTLADLLTPASTIPWLDHASEDTVDQLLQYLPAELTTMAQEADDDTDTDVQHASIEASKQALSLPQKKEILQRVLRSPQFSQSLASLTVALRDGGLPSISEALQIPVRNGGYMRRGGVPLGGGEAVDAFLEGVRDNVQDQPREGDDQMDT